MKNDKIKRFLISIFQLKAFHYWIQCWHHPAQFSLNSICAIKSVISLEMKCPKQARGYNGKEPKLHRWQNREKNLGRNQAQSEGQFHSGQTNQ